MPCTVTATGGSWSTGGAKERASGSGALVVFSFCAIFAFVSVVWTRGWKLFALPSSVTTNFVTRRWPGWMVLTMTFLSLTSLPWIEFRTSSKGPPLPFGSTATSHSPLFGVKMSTSCGWSCGPVTVVWGI